jgi:hypothetical protein
VFFFPEKKRSFAHQSIYTDYEDNLVPAPDCTRNPHPIIVRLSTDQDLRLIISTKGETVGSLRYRIFNAPESKITPESHILRLIYLGRILHDNEAIVCENNSTNDDDLEWKKSAENIVRIDKETIIQALVSPTSIRS